MKELRHTLYATIVFCMVWHAASKSIESEITESCTPSICTDSHQHTFNVGRRYTYEYEVESSTELSGVGEGRSTTFRIAAQVQVQAITKCHLSVSVASAELSSEGQQIPGNQLARFSSELTRYAVEVDWQDGEVVSVCTHMGDSTWSRNVKKGLISLLQNTAAQNGNEHVVDEVDVFGKCKTSYRSTTSADKRTFVKEKDLSHCSNAHTFVESSILFSQYDAVSARSSLLQSTQQCTQIWTRDSALQSTKCSESHLFRPFSYRSNGAKTTVSQSLNLVDVKRDIPPTALTATTTMKSTLLYSHEDENKEEISNHINLVAALDNVCDLLTTSPNYDSIPAAYIAIIKEMKRLSVDDMERVWELIQLARVCPHNLDKIKSIFLNAIPMCVTTNCVEFAVRLLENNNPIKLEKASDWYNAFGLIPNPTEKMISLVTTAVSHPKAPSEVYLTLGTMIHRYCKKTSNCLTSSAVVNALQHFQRALGTNCHTNNEEQITNIILSLRAIGNAGVSTATALLNSCVAETRNTIEVRISAMQALRRMDCRSDKSAIKSLFMDTTEDAELRIAAYTALMRCPSVGMVSYILHVMQNEEVDQVGSYVWSHIMEVKKSSDPLKAYMRGLLQSSRLADKFTKDRRKYSSYFETSLYSETLNLGAESDGSLVWSPKSFVPRSVHANLTVDVFGSAVNLLEIGGRVEGMESLIKDFLGSTVDKNEFLSTLLNQGKERPKRDANDDEEFKTALKEIKSYYPHLHKNNDATGSAYIRTFGNEIGFYKLNTQEAEAESWITTANIAFKLFTGTDFTFQHHRVLMDSNLVIPTGAGIPLKLLVTSASATDVTLSGHFDFTSYILKTNSPIILDTHCKPRAVLDISASMGVEVSSFIKSGVELDSKLSTGFEIKGHVGIQQGKELEIRVDVPQDTTELITFDSKFFTTNGYNKQEMNIPSVSTSDCTTSGSDMLGIKMCTSSLSHAIPQSSNDTMPFIMMLAPYKYQLAMHKTDPGITHYLVKGSYNMFVQEDSIVPDAAEFSFYVGTPESYVPRNFSVNMMFQKSEDDARLYISTLDNSILFSGQLKSESDLKEGAFKVTVNERDVYGIKGQMAKDTSTTDATKWQQSLKIESPYKSPSIECNTTYSVDKNLDVKMKISDILKEDIIVNANVEKLGIIHRARYNGEVKVFVPQIMDVEAEFRSGFRGGGETMKGQIKYGLFGKAQQSVVLQHKYHIIPSNVVDSTRWSSTSEFTSTQFSSLNNKIQVQFYKKPTGVESSLDIDYGSKYSTISNLNKLKIKHYYKNLTTSEKSHYDGGVIIIIPSHNIDYELNTIHIYDWADYKHFESSVTLRKMGTDIVGFSMKALNESKEYTSFRSDMALTTPWGKLHSKQRISQPSADKFSYLSISGLGKSPELQVQMKGDITNKGGNKMFLFHAYQPLDIFNQDEDVELQELPPAKEIALLNATYSKELIDEENYNMNLQFTSRSVWSKNTMANIFSKHVTSRDITTINYGSNFQHGEKVLQFSNLIRKIDREQGEHLNSSQTMELRIDYAHPIMPDRSFSLGGSSHFVSPIYDAISQDSRFDVSMHLNHNFPEASSFVSPNLLLSTSGSISSAEKDEATTHYTAEWQNQISGFTKDPVTSHVNFEIDYATPLNMNYTLSATVPLSRGEALSLNVEATNVHDDMLSFRHEILTEINSERILSAALLNDRHEFMIKYLHDLRQLGLNVFKDMKIDLKSSLIEQIASGEIMFKHIDNDMNISKIHSLFQLNIPRKSLSTQFSHNIAVLEQNAVPNTLNLNANFNSNEHSINGMISLDHDKAVLVSLTSRISYMPGNTANGEVTLNHGIDYLVGYGVGSSMSMSFDVTQASDHPRIVTVSLLNGDYKSEISGTLDLSKNSLLQINLKSTRYDKDEILDQAFIDFEIKDITKPLRFKMRFDENVVEAVVKYDVDYSKQHQSSYNSIAQFSHNIDLLNSNMGIAFNSEFSSLYTEIYASNSFIRKIKLHGSLDSTTFTVTNQIYSDGFGVGRWENAGMHNIPLLRDIGVPMRYNASGSIEVGTTFINFGLQHVYDDDSNKPSIKSASTKLGFDGNMYFVNISTVENQQKNIFVISMDITENSREKLAELQMQHTYDVLKDVLQIPKEVNANLVLEYESIANIFAELNFDDKHFYFKQVFDHNEYKNYTVRCGARYTEEQANEDILWFKAQYTNQINNIISLDFKMYDDTVGGRVEFNATDLMAQIKQNYDADKFPSSLNLNTNLISGEASKYGFIISGGINEMWANYTTYAQITDMGIVVKSDLQHDIRYLEEFLPRNVVLNSAFNSGDAGSYVMHSEITTYNTPIVMFTSTLSNNQLRFKIQSQYEGYLPTMINIVINSDNSILHSKLLLQFANKQATHFVLDISEEDGAAYSIQFTSQNSNDFIESLGIPKHLEGGVKFQSKFSETTLLNLDVNLITSDEVQLELSWKLSVSNGVADLELTSSHNLNNFTPLKNMAVKNKFMRQSDSLLNEFIINQDGITNTLRTEINYMPVTSQHSTGISVSGRLDHDFIGLEEALKVPQNIEMALDLELETHSEDTYWGQTTNFKSLRIATSCTANNKSILKSTGKIVLDLISTIDFTFDCGLNSTLQWGKINLEHTWHKHDSTINLLAKFPETERNIKIVKLVKISPSNEQLSVAIVQNIIEDFPTMNISVYHNYGFGLPNFESGLSVNANEKEILTFAHNIVKTAKTVKCMTKVMVPFFQEMFNAEITGIELDHNSEYNENDKYYDTKLKLLKIKDYNQVDLTMALVDGLYPEISLSHNFIQFEEFPQRVSMLVSPHFQYKTGLNTFELCVEYECFQLTFTPTHTPRFVMNITNSIRATKVFCAPLTGRGSLIYTQDDGHHVSFNHTFMQHDNVPNSGIFSLKTSPVISLQLTTSIDETVLYSLGIEYYNYTSLKVSAQVFDTKGRFSWDIVEINRYDIGLRIKVGINDEDEAINFAIENERKETFSAKLNHIFEKEIGLPSNIELVFNNHTFPSDLVTQSWIKYGKQHLNMRFTIWDGSWNITGAEFYFFQNFTVLETLAAKEFLINGTLKRINGRTHKLNTMAVKDGVKKVCNFVFSENYTVWGGPDLTIDVYDNIWSSYDVIKHTKVNLFAEEIVRSGHLVKLGMRVTYQSGNNLVRLSYTHTDQFGIKENMDIRTYVDMVINLPDYGNIQQHLDLEMKFYRDAFDSNFDFSTDYKNKMNTFTQSFTLNLGQTVIYSDLKMNHDLKEIENLFPGTISFSFGNKPPFPAASTKQFIISNQVKFLNKEFKGLFNISLGETVHLEVNLANDGFLISFPKDLFLNITLVQLATDLKLNIQQIFDEKKCEFLYEHALDLSKIEIAMNLDNNIFQPIEIGGKFKLVNGARPELLIRLTGDYALKISLKTKRSSTGHSIYYKTEHKFSGLQKYIDPLVKGSLKVHRVQDTTSIRLLFTTTNFPEPQQLTIIAQTKNSKINNQMYSITMEQALNIFKVYLPASSEFSIEVDSGIAGTFVLSAFGKMDEKSVKFYSELDRNMIDIEIANSVESFPKTIKAVLYRNISKSEVGMLIRSDNNTWKINATLTKSLKVEIANNDVEMVSLKSSADLTPSVSIVSFDLRRDQNFATTLNLPIHVNEIISFSWEKLTVTSLIDNDSFSSSFTITTTGDSKNFELHLFKDELIDHNYRLMIGYYPPSLKFVFTDGRKEVASIDMFSRFTNDDITQQYAIHCTLKHDFQQLEKFAKNIEVSGKFVKGEFLKGKIEFTVLADKESLLKIKINNLDDLSADVDLGSYKMLLHDKEMGKEIVMAMYGDPQYIVASWDLNPNKVVQFQINVLENYPDKKVIFSVDIDQGAGFYHGLVTIKSGVQTLSFNIKELQINYYGFNHWNVVASSALEHSFDNMLMQNIPTNLKIDIKDHFSMSDYVTTWVITSQEKVLLKKDIHLTQTPMKTIIYATLSQNIFEIAIPQSILGNLQIDHIFNLDDFDIGVQITGNVNHEDHLSLSSSAMYKNDEYTLDINGKYNPDTSSLLHQNDHFKTFSSQIAYSDLQPVSQNDQVKKAKYTLSIERDELTATVDFGKGELMHTIHGSFVHNTEWIQIPRNTSLWLSIKLPQYLEQDSASARISTRWIDEDNAVRIFSLQSEYGADFNTRIYDISTTLKHSLDIFDDISLPRNIKTVVTCQNGNNYSIKVISMDSEILSVVGKRSQGGVSTVNIETSQSIFDNFTIKKGGILVKYDIGKLYNISTTYNDLVPASIELQMNKADSELNLSGKAEFGFLEDILIEMKNIGGSVKLISDERDNKMNLNVFANDVIYFNASTELLRQTENYITFNAGVTKPTNMKLTVTIDSIIQNEITFIGTFNSDEFDHEKYAKLKLGYMQETVLGKVLILIKSSANENDNMVFGFDVHDLSKDSGYSYAVETITKCVSSKVNSRLICKIDNYNDYKHLGLNLKHNFGSDEVEPWKLNVTKNIGMFNLLIQTPLTEEVILNMKETENNRRTMSMKLSDIVSVFGSSEVDLDEPSVILSHGYEDLLNGQSWKINTQLHRTDDEYAMRLFSDQAGSDLLLASFSIKDDNLKLYWSSNNSTAQLIPRKIKEEDYLISKYISRITENTKSFARKLNIPTQEINKLDYTEEFARNIVSECSSAESQFIQFPIAVSTSGRSFKTFMDSVLDQLRLPIEEMRIVYYDSVLVQLKEDVNMAVAKYTRQENETKIVWMLTHLISEIINHKIDKTEIMLYNWLQNIVPTSTDFMEVSDEYIQIEIPLFNVMSNSYIKTMTNRIEGIFGKLFLTQQADSLLNFYEMSFYNKMVSLWHGDDTFLNFAGHAHVIGGHTIVSFDGLVQNIEGEGCSHLLAHDMQEDSFSLIMQKDGNNRISYHLKLVPVDNQTLDIKINHELKVEFNDSSIDLPFKMNGVEIRQQINGVLISDIETGLELSCESKDNSEVTCHLKVSPKHHGSVAGALGTMDGEGYNDQIVSDNSLSSKDISAWKLPSVNECSNYRIPDFAVDTTSNECICDKLFKSSDSSLQSCYGVVSVDAYYENCRINNCDAAAACNLITTYRYICKVKGISTNTPEECAQCDQTEVTMDRTTVEHQHDIVLVVNQGCHRHMYDATMKLMENLKNKQLNTITRFGLITYNNGNEPTLHTMDGELFAPIESVAMPDKNMNEPQYQIKDSGLEAVYLASLHPFAPTAKKSVILITCDKCGDNNEITSEEVSDTMNKLGVQFTILKDEKIMFKDNARRRDVAIGFDSDRVYTRRSLRNRKMKSFSIDTYMPDYDTDVCTNVMTANTDGSFWNANSLSSRYIRMAKRVSNIISQKIRGDSSVSLALTMCRECTCVPVYGGLLHRDVCSAC